MDSGGSRAPRDQLTSPQLGSRGLVAAPGVRSATENTTPTAPFHSMPILASFWDMVLTLPLCFTQLGRLCCLRRPPRLFGVFTLAPVD